MTEIGKLNYKWKIDGKGIITRIVSGKIHVDVQRYDPINIHLPPNFVRVLQDYTLSSDETTVALSIVDKEIMP